MLKIEIPTHVINVDGWFNTADSETGLISNGASAAAPSFTSLPAYIHSLADDILLEIFTLFLNESKSTTGYNTPFQYILTTVCRRWRSLVLNSPLLWTKIHLPLESPFDLSTYFERSKPALIDVWYDSSTRWIADESDVSAHDFNAISTHIARLRSLTIHVWDWQEVDHIFNAWTDKEASQLENLKISTHGTPSDSTLRSLLPSENTDIPAWFRGGRNLKSLNLESFTLQGFLPLPSLTSLRVDRLETSVVAFQNLLHSCPLLETLVIRQFEGALSNAEDCKRQINAPSLRSLAINIDNNHAADCGCFLPFFYAPNLEYLEVAYLWESLTTHHKAIFSHWNHLRNLRTLRIRGLSMWRDDDVSFLASLPVTTDLYVNDFPLVEAPTLSNILNLTNLKSVTLYLNNGSFNNFSDVLPNLPKPRRPFFLQSPRSDDVLTLELQLQTEWGNAASIILPSMDKGFLDVYLNSQLFGDEETMSYRLWGFDSDEEDEEGIYDDGEYDEDGAYAYDFDDEYVVESPYDFDDESDEESPYQYDGLIF